MNSLAVKYIYKLSQSVDSAIMALQIIRNAPTKAFQEDLDERIKALDSYIAHAQDARRWLLYFKNKSAKPSGTDFTRLPG
jgi:hypothetical protein